jgi:hypothetical protein
LGKSFVILKKVLVNFHSYFLIIKIQLNLQHFLFHTHFMTEDHSKKRKASDDEDKSVTAEESHAKKPKSTLTPEEEVDSLFEFDSLSGTDESKTKSETGKEENETQPKSKLAVNTIYMLEGGPRGLLDSGNCLLVMADGPFASHGVPAGAIGCVQSREQARRYARVDSRYRKIPKEFLDEAFGPDDKNIKCGNCLRVPEDCKCGDVLECESCGFQGERGNEEFCDDCGLCWTRLCCDCEHSD